MYAMRAKSLLNLMSDRLYALPLVVLYLTDGCNSRCVSCDIWRNARRNMSLDLVEQVVSEIKVLGIRWVLLSGGEAMQHPEWPQIALRFRDAGVYVMLLTNGLLLRKQAQMLPTCVDEVIVSLDAGSAATYLAIRGVDAYDVVLQGIQAARDVGVLVKARTTVQRANFLEIPQIITTALAHGVQQVSFLPVDVGSPEAFGARFEWEHVQQPATSLALNASELQELRELLRENAAQLTAWYEAGLLAESPAKLGRLADYFDGLLDGRDHTPPHCNAPHISVVVEVDGRVRPCYFLPVVGALEGQPIRTVVNEPLAIAMRRAYRAGERMECANCVCPLYKGPRALLRM